MKSIKLDVDALVVESFGTADDGIQARGTVRAHGITEPDWETCGTCDERLTVCGAATSCDFCYPETHACPFTDPQEWTCDPRFCF